MSSQHEPASESVRLHCWSSFFIIRCFASKLFLSIYFSLCSSCLFFKMECVSNRKFINSFISMDCLKFLSLQIYVCAFKCNYPISNWICGRLKWFYLLFAAIYYIQFTVEVECAVKSFAKSQWQRLKPFEPVANNLGTIAMCFFMLFQFFLVGFDSLRSSDAYLQFHHAINLKQLHNYMDWYRRLQMHCIALETKHSHSLNHSHLLTLTNAKRTM